MTEPLLVVEHLFKSFDGVDAVRDVSFTVTAGEIVAMIGPNGAGKTTCFNLIHRQLRPDAGDIRFQGASIIGLPTHAIAHRGIGRTFQIPATFASMTVRESIAIARAASDRRDGAMMAKLRPNASAQGDATLKRLRIDDLRDTHCAALAYGNAKRLELAMALAWSPKLLLMDEPTAGMAQPSRRELMQLVIDLAHADGRTVLFTEHDMDIVFGFADRVIVLDRGRAIADGTPNSIQGDKTVQRVYLNEV